MTEPRSTEAASEAAAREVGFQSSYRAPFSETFAHLVGQRSGPPFETQPGYLALYIGGHNGVRVSLSRDQAQAVADLIRHTLTFGVDDGSNVRLRDVEAWERQQANEAERSALSDAEDEAWLESKPEPVA